MKQKGKAINRALPFLVFAALKIILMLHTYANTRLQA